MGKFLNRLQANCGKQIQDGGRPPSLKIEKSLDLCKGLTDFDEIWHDDTSRAPDTLS